MENELALLNNYLVVGAILFGIGVIGFLSRRNMIVMFPVGRDDVAGHFP